MKILGVVLDISGHHAGEINTTRMGVHPLHTTVYMEMTRILAYGNILKRKVCIPYLSATATFAYTK